MSSAEKPTTAATQPAEPAYEPQGNPFVAAVLAWMVFGAGHLYLGKRWKAVVLFVSLTTMFVVGMKFGSFLYFTDQEWAGTNWRVIFDLVVKFGFFWSGLFYFGALTFLDPAGRVEVSTYEVGWVAAISAALLNLLAILDAWDIAKGRKG
jgi:uncharacterized protein DUF6677